MKKRFINELNVEGLLYEHNLELRQTGENSKNPGTEYIRGTIGIATDDEVTNIVPISYTYVPAVNSRGEMDRRYEILKGIIDGKYPTIIEGGSSDPVKIRVSRATIALNEFIPKNSTDNELVVTPKNDGGFNLEIIRDLNNSPLERAKFTCDMVITNLVTVPANEDYEIPEKTYIKGVIFDNYRKAILPVQFPLATDKAVAYFESMEPTPKNPFFTKVWGPVITSTVKRTIVEESAFGDDYVREVPRSRKEYLVTNAAKEPYLWDDETTLLASELTDMINDREVHVAEETQRQLEFRNKAKTATASNSGYNFSSSGNGGFNF